MVALLLATSACASGEDGGAIPAFDPDRLLSQEEQEAAARYGYGPSPHPSVTLQPDVVLIGGGPSAIRSASADGFTWTLDGSAPGVRDLEPGKVLFASSLAVGRVIQVEEAGADVAVTVLPVELTDIIRDAHLTIDEPLDLGGFRVQELPAYPDGGVEPNPLADLTEDLDDSYGVPLGAQPASPSPQALGAVPGTSHTATVSTQTVTMPTIQLIPGTAAQTGGELPPPVQGGRLPTFDMAGFAVTPHLSSSQFGFRVARTMDGLKLSGDLHFEVVDPRVRGVWVIEDGVIGKAEAFIQGINALAVTLQAGVEHGLDDNQNFKFEIPVHIGDFLLPIYGIPTNFSLDLKFIITTGFTARNSTLSWSGRWEFGGEISSGTAATGPSASERDALVASVQGASPGVTAFLFAADVRLSWGVGTPMVQAGPWGRLTLSVGTTRGSDLAAPLAGGVVCRHGTVLLMARTGVGLSMSDAVKSTIRSIVDAVNAGLSFRGMDGAVAFDPAPERILQEWTLLERQQAIPDVPMCRI
jgi:hypothetical protein